MKYICCLLLTTASLHLFAETKTFIRDYTYTAGEADSKITSRVIALDQVKRLLLEEIGVYLQSELQTTKEEKNGVYSELTKEQTQSVTAGITETKIIEERWNGETYYIKASITLDPDEVTKQINRIAADQERLKEVEEITQKADEAIAEINKLRKELDSTKSVTEKLAEQKQYVAASDNLSATDWFQKGYNAHELKDYDNAILYYQKAIELNPQFSLAYENLGIAYYAKGYLDKATQYCQNAINLNPQFADAYFLLGNIYSELDTSQEYEVRLIRRHKAIQFYEKAIELKPRYSDAYSNLGTADCLVGAYDKAIHAFEKAIEINPQDSRSYVGLGLIYYDKYSGFYSLKKTVQVWKKAAQLGSQDAQEWLKGQGYTW